MMRRLGDLVSAFPGAAWRRAALFAAVYGAMCAAISLHWIAATAITTAAGIALAYRLKI